MIALNALTKRIVMICLLAFSIQCYAFTLVEDAIETESLRITLNDNKGYIQGRLCDYCELLTVEITAETKAFKNDTEVPLKRAASRIGRPATVFINIEHTKVIRIVW